MYYIDNYRERAIKTIVPYLIEFPQIVKIIEQDADRYQDIENLIWDIVSQFRVEDSRGSILMAHAHNEVVNAIYTDKANDAFTYANEKDIKTDLNPSGIVDPQKNAYGTGHYYNQTSYISGTSKNASEDKTIRGVLAKIIQNNTNCTLEEVREGVKDLYNADNVYIYESNPLNVSIKLEGDKLELSSSGNYENIKAFLPVCVSLNNIYVDAKKYNNFNYNFESSYGNSRYPIRIGDTIDKYSLFSHCIPLRNVYKEYIKTYNEKFEENMFVCISGEIDEFTESSVLFSVCDTNNYLKVKILDNDFCVDYNNTEYLCNLDFSSIKKFNIILYHIENELKVWAITKTPLNCDLDHDMSYIQNRLLNTTPLITISNFNSIDGVIHINCEYEYSLNVDEINLNIVYGEYEEQQRIYARDKSKDKIIEIYNEETDEYLDIKYNAYYNLEYLDINTIYFNNENIFYYIESNNEMITIDENAPFQLENISNITFVLNQQREFIYNNFADINYYNIIFGIIENSIINCTEYYNTSFGEKQILFNCLENKNHLPIHTANNLSQNITLNQSNMNYTDKYGNGRCCYFDGKSNVDYDFEYLENEINLYAWSNEEYTTLTDEDYIYTLKNNDEIANGDLFYTSNGNILTYKDEYLYVDIVNDIVNAKTNSNEFGECVRQNMHDTRYIKHGTEENINKLNISFDLCHITSLDENETIINLFDDSRISLNKDGDIVYYFYTYNDDNKIILNNTYIGNKLIKQNEYCNISIEYSNNKINIYKNNILENTLEVNNNILSIPEIIRFGSNKYLSNSYNGILRNVKISIIDEYDNEYKLDLPLEYTLFENNNRTHTNNGVRFITTPQLLNDKTNLDLYGNKLISLR